MNWLVFDPPAVTRLRPPHTHTHTQTAERGLCVSCNTEPISHSSARGLVAVAMVVVAMNWYVYLYSIFSLQLASTHSIHSNGLGGIED